MEVQKEESEFVVEAGKGVCDVSVADEEHVKDDVVSAEESKDDVEKAVRSDGVEKSDAFGEPEAERSQMECDGAVEEKVVDGENAGGEETVNVISDGVEVSDEKVNCEVEEDSGGVDSDATTSDVEQNVHAEKSLKSTVDGEMLSVVEDKTDQDKEPANGSDEDKSKQGNEGNVQEESTQLSKEETNEEETTAVNHKEEGGEAMEIDYAAEEVVEKDDLDNAGNESIQHVATAEADRNDTNVVKEMETDEGKANADMATESAGSANPSSLTEDAAPGEVEPLDHNGLFDPTSDITNYIDFSGVSSWSGNIQDLKTETGNVSLKDDKKATDLAEEVATEGCNKALKSDKLSSSAEGVENVGSDQNQEEKDQQSLQHETVDQQETMREEGDSTHEAPSVEQNQNEDTVMEENLNNSNCADVGTDSDTKPNGVKQKADVLSEDSLGEGRKTASLAKLSFAQRPSFKIGACIARAASQMAGSPSVLKGSNFGDETLSVESFVSQLHSAATDPVKENVVSDIAAEFLLDFRNSSASQQYTQEKVSRKRGRPSNSNAGGTEAFEFEEMGDTYWNDRVIHNVGEEQTPHNEKENNQVVSVEVKPAPVKKTRRPYRRRQSQISIPLPLDSDKPANFDENAPAELIMNFAETDTIPPEKSLSKMFRHFGPIRDSQTEVDKEKNRARVVFRKGADAEVAYKSAGRFNIFGTKAVNYELSFTITETFKVQPYVVSLGEEEAMLSVPS